MPQLAITHILSVFFCSMVPLIELRGSVILGAGFGVPWYITLPLSVIGNMLPIPFILLFIRRILEWMKGVRHLDKIALWLEQKAHKKSGRIQKSAAIGLLLFVGIPLPGTGAWTGALIAALLDIRMKYALPCIFCGVLLAGVIMTLASYGFVGFLSFLG